MSADLSVCEELVWNEVGSRNLAYHDHVTGVVLEEQSNGAAVNWLLHQRAPQHSTAMGRIQLKGCHRDCPNTHE